MQRGMILHSAVVALIGAVALPLMSSSHPALQERTEPRVLERAEPQYPPEEREKGTEGRVRMETMIRADGAVEVIRVVRSLGAVMDRAAIEAVEKWRFEPGTIDGRPVDMRLRVDVVFSLEQPSN